jgi:energy-converting hydrogenase B subunit Q
LSEEPRSIALLCDGADRPGTLHAITAAILKHGGNITGIEIPERGERARVHVEVDLPADADPDELLKDLRGLQVLDQVEAVPTMAEVYGKRIIVVGGGAQVGQVALGAISEADRHNIRGEKISIDTIPIVGEQNLAAAVRAVARLPRAVALVLAGALMGGDITAAVVEVRARGILVISLNMAGSVPKAADLVVSDPVQAGVMAVMAVAKTARFDIARQRGRSY